MRAAPWLIGVTVTLPLAVATAWMLVVAAGERSGHQRFAGAPYRNSAEAAAVGDAAAVLRLIRMGDNPSWVHQVRPQFTSSGIAHLTTAEAAVWSRQIGLVRLLEREGAMTDVEERHRLACLARDLGAPEIADHLAPGAACVAPGGAARGPALGRIGGARR